tara:strand:- start:39299 stop:40543 length:1245 start_codon:yes stop_codon:yes gene_type:complete
MYQMGIENKNLEAINALVVAKGNKAEAAKTLGIPRTTLIGRLEAAEREGIAPTVNAPDTDAALIEQKILYDMQISDLKKQVKELALDNITAEQIRKTVFKLHNRTAKPPKWLRKSSPAHGAPGVPTLFLSDLHWGEVVNPDEVNGLNKYDRSIAKARLKSTIESTIDLCTNHMVNPKYPGIVLCLGGDMISGHIHEELTETNDGTNIEHVLELFDHLTWAIDSLADVFGKVFVPCAFGNHGRMFRQYRHKQAAATSFDWMLYTMLEKHYTNAKDKRVQFQINYGFDSYYKIYDVNYLLTHGDRLGVKGGSGVVGMLGPISRGVAKVKAEYATHKKPIDYVIMGHWHQYLSLKGIIVNGSLKGYDEYAMSNRFSYEEPRQALWFTHPKYGITFQLPVISEQALDKKPKSEWVKWI